MLANRTILFLIALLLSCGGDMAIASEDNPWRMDEPDAEQHPYFDLETGEAAGFSGEGQKNSQFARSQPPGKSGGGNETIRARTPSVGAGAGMSGKGDRDRYFGYAGPQSKANPANPDPADRFKFGGFPPVNGTVDAGRNSASPSRSAGGVQFGGKSYGAFPPKEQKPVDIKRQQWQAFQAYRQRQKQQSTGFANVAPPPVPEPVPERRFPFAGYGMQPGFGTGIAPRYGAGRYGPGYATPAMPGLTMPGFMW